MDGKLKSARPYVAFARIQGRPATCELPEIATSRSVGMDIFSPVPVPVLPGKLCHVETGLRIQCVNAANEEIDPDTWPNEIEVYIGLEDKSSVASIGLELAGGVVDIDYKGEVIVMLRNCTNELIELPQGRKLCQAILHDSPVGMWKTVRKLKLRGSGGFGSTGQ